MLSHTTHLTSLAPLMDPIRVSTSAELPLSHPDYAKGFANVDSFLQDSLDNRECCSDISTVPNELLLAIFFQYLTLNLHRGFGSQSCITLTSVCRRWRILGLSASSLWMFISITPRSKKAWVKSQLSRSSQHSLVVYAASSTTSRRCRTVVSLRIWVSRKCIVYPISSSFFPGLALATSNTTSCVLLRSSGELASVSSGEFRHRPSRRTSAFLFWKK